MRAKYVNVGKYNGYDYLGDIAPQLGMKVRERFHGGLNGVITHIDEMFGVTTVYVRFCGLSSDRVHTTDSLLVGHRY